MNNAALAAQAQDSLKFTAPGRHKRIIDAMLKADRINFLPEESLCSAYCNMPVSIGYAQTCSQPSLVAEMISMLELKPGMTVREAGAGSGYAAAIISHIVGCSGHVVAVERIPELAKFAEKNLRKHFGSEFEKRITVLNKDGSVLHAGEPEYDRILISAAAPQGFNPALLAAGFRNSTGIMVFPHGGKNQIIRKLVYDQGRVKEHPPLKNVIFVPLIGKNR